MSLSEVVVDIVVPEQEARFRALMQAHHYLGALPKIGETLWYVAHLNGTWLALAVFSAAALKCRARDAWVGWDFRTQYGRLHLVSNNTRLLLLPGRHPNLGSRVLGLCARRIVRDWPARFGQAPRRVRLEVATTAAGPHVVDSHLRQLGVERELLRVVSAQWDRAARSAAGDVPVRVAVPSHARWLGAGRPSASSAPATAPSSSPNNAR